MRERRTVQPVPAHDAIALSSWRRRALRPAMESSRARSAKAATSSDSVPCRGVIGSSMGAGSGRCADAPAALTWMLGAAEEGDAPVYSKAEASKAYRTVFMDHPHVI